MSSSQKRISSYFTPSQNQSNSAKSTTKPSAKALGKRPASFVDLTVDDDEIQNVSKATLKKARKVVNPASERETADDVLFLPEHSPEPPTDSSAQTTSTWKLQNGRFTSVSIQSPPRTQASVVDKYRFDASPQKDNKSEDILTAEQKKKKAARREAFRRKLLEDNSLFSTTPHSAAAVDESDRGQTSEREAAEGDSDEERPSLPSDIKMKAFMNLVETSKFSKSTKQVGRKTVDKKATEEVGPSGQTYTPLENQIRHLKKKYPDVILMVEVGYKYRFFGEDAKIASKELGIVAFTDRNFVTAGIPTHRREVHLKKLLSRGYKVGIVGQLETAALKKVSDNRNAPFERELTHLYTAATYVDEIGSVDDPSLSSPGDAPVLVCISEAPLGGMGTDERVSFGLIAVTPSTGEVVWDDFEDGFMRSEIETRIAHIKPVELLLPENKLSKASENILQHFTKEGIPGADSRRQARVERYKGHLKYSEAFQKIQTFYTQKCSTASENFSSGKLLEVISNLPHRVTIALAHTIRHLNKFGLSDILTQTEFFTKFTARQHMLLNANTLSNLEIYRNQTDYTTKGSLMWVLNRTKTAFGARLLRTWLGRPLTDIQILQERVNAIEEILSAQSTQQRELLVRLREVLKGLPDLARGLCRIQYKKCAPSELALLLKAFEAIANAFGEFASSSAVGFKSSLINEVFCSLPRLKEVVRAVLPAINMKKAEKNEKSELWLDPEKFPSVEDEKMGILMVESELEEELTKVRKLLKKPSAKWVEVAGEEYLIEIGRNEARPIPDTWFIVSSTRKVKRYHTPDVKRLLQARAQHQEKLDAESNKAFSTFLSEIIDNFYTQLRNAVNKLALADCLLSMATVASQEGYVKPVFAPDDRIEIKDGRHPMVEMLRTDPYVPNSIFIGGESSRTKVITGPNMGGKSSTVRMVALIGLMAQVGSYVPAASVKMGLLDAIYTRMGASDDLARGRSTFMVEMSETSDILRSATSRSLVILDELGRGTSTFDGMAIAGATLEHLVQTTRCKTLFITHYPLLAASIQRKFPTEASNVHMAFAEEVGIDGIRTVTFLYALVEGISSGSYGIECARLAGLPESLLEAATEKAENMEKEVATRSRINQTKRACSILRSLIRRRGQQDSTDTDVQLGELREIMDIMTTVKIK